MSNGRFDGHIERRRNAICLVDDAQINLIAERAADRAVEKITSQIYREIGRTVLQKLIWVVGAVAIGAYMYMQSQGMLKK